MDESSKQQPGPGATFADVVILGASFAGIEAYRLLRRNPVTRKLRVVVVDRLPDHGYIPLVHERVCGRIPAGTSSLPTRKWIERDPRAKFVTDTVVGMEPERGLVHLQASQAIKARFIIVALGSSVAPPTGIEGHQFLACLKFEPDFEQLRARLNALLDNRKPASSIVIVGGGISGVELAGDLAHLRRQKPVGWQVPRVTLVQSRERLLPKLGRSAGAKALKKLRAQGVDVRLQTRLLSAQSNNVSLQTAGGAGSETISCDLALWTGGLQPAPILAKLGLPLTEEGWLRVGPTLQCFAEVKPRMPEIFACGDAPRVFGGGGQWPTMQRAIECLWQAQTVVKNIATLAAEPAGYPHGVPPLVPHKLRTDFFHGVSVGAYSMITYGPIALELGPLAVWFRRFLMRQYFARYRAE